MMREKPSKKEIKEKRLTINDICQSFKITQKELWEIISDELNIPCDWTPKFCPSCGSFLAWLKIYNATVTCVECERRKQ